MKRMRIVQGGIENGDKASLERLAANGGSTRSWIVPKESQPGDEVVIYIAGYGFFATATIASRAKPRNDWPNRYGAGLESIELIVPAISLAAVRRHLPGLTWAVYPRSITTPTTAIAKHIQSLIRDRRKTRLPDLDDESLRDANIDELRAVALMRSRASAPRLSTTAVYRVRSLAIKLYVLKRADGNCEYCDATAPFSKPDGSPYLEPHHTTRLSDDGPDHPSHVIALCPNCHRRAHHANDASDFNRKLKRLLRTLEPK